MKRLAVALSSILSLAAALMAGPYDGVYAAYKTITVTPTVTGGDLANQSDFPLLVRFYNNDASRGSDVLAGSLNSGLDVRFTTGDGVTPLAFERETWSAGSATFWVRLPTINGTTSGTGVATAIRVYYGNIGAGDTSSSSAVFDTAAGFRAVFHMNGASSTANETDATQNGFVAMAVGAPATSTAGLGASRRFTAADAVGQDSAHFIVAQALTMYGVHMRDANNGVASSIVGHALKTTDGGITWAGRKTGGTVAGAMGTGSSSSNNIFLNSVTCAPNNTNICYGVGGSSSYMGAGTVRFVTKSTDGGDTWTKQDSSGTTSNTLYGASCNSDTSCVIVGGSVTTTRRFMNLQSGGASWNVPASATRATQFAVYCVPDASDNDKYCYSVGGNAATTRVIIRWTNVGGVWSEARLDSTATSGALYGVHCLDKDICYAVGNNGVIVKTTDASTTGTWTLQTSGTTKNLRSVYCTDANTCVAVGTALPWASGNVSTILKTTDGGTNWASKSPAAFGDSLYSVKFTSSNNGIIVGANGTVFRTTDAGETWTLNANSRKLAPAVNGSFRYSDSTSGAGHGDNYAMSVWANMVTGGGQQTPFGKGDFHWTMQTTSGNLYNVAERNFRNGLTATYSAPPTGNTTWNNADGAAISAGWHHVAGSRNNTADAETLFVDGGTKCGGSLQAINGTFQTTTALSSGNQGYQGAVAIGRGTDLYRRFWRRGELDEVRFYGTNRGADWFCLSYQFQTPDTAAYYSKVTMSAPVSLRRADRAGTNAINIGGANQYSFDIPAGYAESAELRIVDVVGRTVWSSSVRLNGKASTVSWNGRDAAGNRVNAGVYFARLKTVNQGKTQELALKGTLSK